MKQTFGRSDRSVRFRVSPIVLSAMASAWILLTSCSYVQSREVTISPASAAEMESYYQDEAFSRDGLSFESENFLRGNMEQDDLDEDPELTLHRLNEYYTISDNPKYLRIAADFCRRSTTRRRRLRPPGNWGPASFRAMTSPPSG